MGFKAMPQDNCVLKCSPIPGHPPIYVGLYVDNFIYYSKPDKVEEWFEQNLKSHVKVNFMGEVDWFLGKRYKWEQKDGKVYCHVSQEAFVEALVEKHGMSECKLARTPYRLGCVVDCIPDDGVPLDKKAPLIKAYQSIIGCINWLCINTRPNIATIYKLLS